jgi:hypothetical protein
MNKKQALPWENPRFRNWIAVARACHVMGQTLARELQPLDIKPPHLDILINLFRTPGISQQDLADKLLVGRSNLSMLLPQMEKRGLLIRRGDPRDRRVLRLELTPTAPIDRTGNRHPVRPDRAHHEDRHGGRVQSGWRRDDPDDPRTDPIGRHCASPPHQAYRIRRGSENEESG